MEWYRVGTVSVSNGSKTVNGSGTLWVDSGVLFPGDIFVVDGVQYEIDTINNNTQLVLIDNFAGSTASGKAYQIIPIGLLPSTLALQVKQTMSDASAALDAAAHSVRYDTDAQGLDSTQQANARANIDAFAASGGTMTGPLASTSTIKTTSDNNADGSNIVVETNSKDLDMYALQVKRGGNTVAGIGVGGGVAGGNFFNPNFPLKPWNVGGVYQGFSFGIATTIGLDCSAYATGCYSPADHVWKHDGAYPATLYEHLSGSHTWRTAGVGAPGNDVTWLKTLIFNATNGLVLPNDANTPMGAVTKQQLDAAISALDARISALE